MPKAMTEGKGKGWENSYHFKGYGNNQKGKGKRWLGRKLQRRERVECSANRQPQCNLIQRPRQHAETCDGAYLA